MLSVSSPLNSYPKGPKTWGRIQNAPGDNNVHFTPSTELLLQAFKGLSLHKVTLEGHIREHMTPLSKLQEEILERLGLGKEIYNLLVQMSVGYYVEDD